MSEFISNNFSDQDILLLGVMKGMYGSEVLDAAIAQKMVTGRSLGAEVVSAMGDQAEDLYNLVKENPKTAAAIVFSILVAHKYMRANALSAEKKIKDAEKRRIKKWTNSDGTINWPPNDGFDGEAIAKTLPKGTRIDRYGHLDGKFASPEGVPLEQRALFPGSDMQYRVYEVVKPIDVKAGNAIPWFDQPGGGAQYKLEKSIVELLDGNYIKEILK